MHTWKVWFSVVNILDIHFQGVNAQFTYELSDDAEGLFEINPSTGIIRVARGGQVLDRETNSRFTLTVYMRFGYLCFFQQTKLELIMLFFEYFV